MLPLLPAVLLGLTAAGRGRAALAPLAPARAHTPLLGGHSLPPREEAMKLGAPLSPQSKPRVVTPFFTLRLIGVLLGVISGFTGFFMVVERWSLIDALYFTSSGLATIGFGDLRPETRIGRVLSSLLGILGVGLLGGLVSATFGAWQDEVEEKRLRRSPALAKALGPTLPFESSRLMQRSRTFSRMLAPWKQTVALLGIGIVGFKSCERATWETSIYLIIGTLTTAGLGDVVPTKRTAKLFLALYAPLAVVTFARVLGSLALRPLEYARRKAQRAILQKFETEGLTAKTFDDLARGPMVQRLRLSSDSSTCTRDEFTLLTLVLQGKVTENDLAECRAAFDVLDVTKQGRLSIEDLETIRQAKQMRMAPKMRRRAMRRMRRKAEEAFGQLMP